MCALNYRTNSIIISSVPGLCLWGLRPRDQRARDALHPPEVWASLQPRPPKVLRQTTLQVQQLGFCKHAPAGPKLIVEDLIRSGALLWRTLIDFHPQFAGRPFNVATAKQSNLVWVVFTSSSSFFPVIFKQNKDFLVFYGNVFFCCSWRHSLDRLPNFGYSHCDIRTTYLYAIIRRNKPESYSTSKNSIFSAENPTHELIHNRSQDFNNNNNNSSMNFNSSCYYDYFSRRHSTFEYI